MTTEQELMMRPEFRDLDRSYGAGKFDTYKTAYLYELSLAGADDELGDVDSYGILYTRMDGPFEHPRLAKVAGAILTNDSGGFVTARLYVSEKALQAAWTEIETLIDTAEGME